MGPTGWRALVFFRAGSWVRFGRVRFGGLSGEASRTLGVWPHLAWVWLPCLLLLGGQTAWGQAGFLELEKGQVQVTRSPWPEFYGLPHAKAQLEWQDRIHSGKASQVRLSLEGGLGVRLWAETFLQINKTLAQPVLLQPWGRAEYQGPSLQVQTINALVLGQNSRFWVEANGPVTRVFVGQGTLQVSFLAFPQTQVDLGPKEWVELTSEKPLPKPVPMPPEWTPGLEQGERNLPGLSGLEVTKPLGPKRP